MRALSLHIILLENLHDVLKRMRQKKMKSMSSAASSSPMVSLVNVKGMFFENFDIFLKNVMHAKLIVINCFILNTSLI
jgi:hypothetical protein